MPECQWPCTAAHRTIRRACAIETQCASCDSPAAAPATTPGWWPGDRGRHATRPCCNPAHCTAIRRAVRPSKGLCERRPAASAQVGSPAAPPHVQTRPGERTELFQLLGGAPRGPPEKGASCLNHGHSRSQLLPLQRIACRPRCSCTGIAVAPQPSPPPARRRAAAGDALVHRPSLHTRRPLTTRHEPGRAPPRPRGQRAAGPRL